LPGGRLGHDLQAGQMARQPVADVNLPENLPESLPVNPHGPGEAGG
jgi:hypothetical protein